MSKIEKSFMARARSWISKNDLHGPHAFLRFVMFVFVERLNQATEKEFVLKGGNLLWVYIRTPRSTVDLDFVTQHLNDHKAVRNQLDVVCKDQAENDVAFEIVSFKEVSKLAASVVVEYRTPEGQSNKFDLDIVYAPASSIATIMSPLDNKRIICAATMENIVADKTAAIQRFGGGNTRMKDFDDLWRIAKTQPDPIEWKNLAQLFKERSISPELDPEWVNSQMAKAWKSHCKRSPGLPEDLEELIVFSSRWLVSGLSKNSK